MGFVGININYFTYKVQILAIILVSIVTTSLGAFEERQVKFQTVQHPLPINDDGDLSDWKSGKLDIILTPLYPETNFKVDWTTDVYALWGPDALYIAFSAKNPKTNETRYMRHRRDDTSSNMDLVGIDLDPTGTKGSAIRFEVSPLGCQNDASVTDAAALQPGPSSQPRAPPWQPPASCDAFRGTTGAWGLRFRWPSALGSHRLRQPGHTSGSHTRFSHLCSQESQLSGITPSRGPSCIPATAQARGSAGSNGAGPESKRCRRDLRALADQQSRAA